MTDNKLVLPAVDTSVSEVDKLVDALGLPREVVASSDEITGAWTQLPTLLHRILPANRDELIARMCMATAVGLFDAALNYVWNAVVRNLRNRVRSFGLATVAQITGEPFSEASLNELRDSDLLELCLKLNLISEQGFFYLDRCRDLRNQVSAAHPPIADVDQFELMSFVSRCSTHALSDAKVVKGVDVQSFISAVNSGKFSDEQKQHWVLRLRDTNEMQRQSLLMILYGVYCDSEKSETARRNAVQIATDFADELTQNFSGELIDRHQSYIAQGKEDKAKASKEFLKALKGLSLLSDTEKHSLFTSAADTLLKAHLGYNNFHNEPPFANRLSDLVKQASVPESAQPTYVSVVVLAAIGNGHGVSTGAMPYYRRMIRGFSPREVAYMLTLPEQEGRVARRIEFDSACRDNFRSLVELLEGADIPARVQHLYDTWTE